MNCSVKFLSPIVIGGLPIPGRIAGAVVVAALFLPAGRGGDAPEPHAASVSAASAAIAGRQGRGHEGRGTLLGLACKDRHAASPQAGTGSNSREAEGPEAASRSRPFRLMLSCSRRVGRPSCSVEQ